MHRIAIGFDLTNWTSAQTEYLTGSVMTSEEAKTFQMVRATGIFYSKDPFRFLADLAASGFDADDFNWINISKDS